jgi:Na+/melibiose symporter-like transporter
MSNRMAQDNVLAHSACMRYGLLGLPLAFVALPLYVHLPHLYANQHGLSLTTLGMVLLLARLSDALTDPWLGRWVDRCHVRSARDVLRAGALAATVLCAGLGCLLFPPQQGPVQAWQLMGWLMLTYLAYSLLTLLHQAWGARLGGNEIQRARLVAWREGAGLLGVITASILPMWLGWDAWLAVFAVGLGLGGWAWQRGPRAQPTTSAPTSWTWQAAMQRPWRHAAFRQLLGVFVLNGLASAIPATLVLFFVQDRLQAPTHGPLFLALYFLAAAAALPMWMRVIARWGLARTWLMGMLLSVSVFAWAATLTSGDALVFAWVCALSGMALGTDLAVPSAMLTGLIGQHGDQGTHEGSYLGWWNLASKLNLALAAGLSLPLLELLGYQPGSTNESGLQALTLAYAVLPCLLKVLAAMALQRMSGRFGVEPLSTV